ncbi:MAG TPA: MFS transporter [Candidatus Aquilonibacter sp.]|nr:MFS transporter [Candidatus Aquilonibacter sp.]
MAAFVQRGVFSSPQFRQYFIGQSLSMLGDGLRTLAIPLLAFKLTHSALSTGTAFICEIVPFSLFALVGGSLADRVDRKTLMIACDAVRFVVMTLFAILWVAHALTLPMIYGGLVVISICAAAFLGGQSPSIPYLLGKDRATAAMASLTAAENTSNLITPVIGGAIFAWFGPLPALVINALTYLASQISLSRIDTLGPDNPHGMPNPREIASDVKLGFRTLFGDPGMRAQAILAFFMNIFGWGAYATVIPFLKNDFGATDQQIGIFWGLVAIGSLTGSALAVRTASKWRFGRALSIAYTIDAFVFLPIVFVRNLWAVAFFWALTSGCVMFEFAQIVGFRLRVTPEPLVGRMMGAVRVFVLGGMAPGVLVLSWIADHRDPRIAMGVCAFAYLFFALLVWVTPAIRDERR